MTQTGQKRRHPESRGLETRVVQAKLEFHLIHQEFPQTAWHGFEFSLPVWFTSGSTKGPADVWVLEIPVCVSALGVFSVRKREAINVDKKELCFGFFTSRLILLSMREQKAAIQRVFLFRGSAHHAGHVPSQGAEKGKIFYSRSGLEFRISCQSKMRNMTHRVTHKQEADRESENWHNQSPQKTDHVPVQALDKILSATR